MWHCFSLAPETLPVNSATPIEVIAVGASGGDRCEAATVASPSSIAGASTELEVLKVRAPGGDRVSSPTPVALFQPSRKGDGDGKSGYRRGQSVQLKPCRLRATDCLRRGSTSHRTKHIAIIAAVICIKDESPTRKETSSSSAPHIPMEPTCYALLLPLPPPVEPPKGGAHHERTVRSYN